MDDRHSIKKYEALPQRLYTGCRRPINSTCHVIQFDRTDVLSTVTHFHTMMHMEAIEIIVHRLGHLALRNCRSKLMEQGVLGRVTYTRPVTLGTTKRHLTTSTKNLMVGRRNVGLKNNNKAKICFQPKNLSNMGCTRGKFRYSNPRIY